MTIENLSSIRPRTLIKSMPTKRMHPYGRKCIRMVQMTQCVSDLMDIKEYRHYHADDLGLEREINFYQTQLKDFCPNFDIKIFKFKKTNMLNDLVALCNPKNM